MGKESLHQELMDKAYSLWSKHNDWSYEDFIENIPKHLTDLHLYAVVIGNLNYQVENGGWLQWYSNGYHVSAEAVREALRKFSEYSESAYKYSKKVLTLMDDALTGLERYDEVEKLVYNGDFTQLERYAGDLFGVIDQTIIREKIERVADKYDILSSDEVEKFAEEICRYCDIDVQKEVAHLLQDGCTIEEVSDFIYEELLYQEAQRYLDGTRNFLKGLDQEYYVFNKNFLQEFDRWLRHCVVVGTLDELRFHNYYVSKWSKGITSQF